ncbi:MAG: diguanylate cyclase [Sulfurimonas sp.]|nr:diguanylate cyclase [Sulfurimonas sp.]
MKTILCVDDIQTNLFTLEAIFQTHHNDKYNIITALSGKEALDVLLKTKIDLILLDIMMPEMDGYETAELILNNKKTKDIPIIFLTAKKSDDVVSRCYTIGAVDYLSKPYNANELFVRIAFHLERIQNKHDLEKERQLFQDILDIQDNLIIISDGKNIVKANKALYDFYNIKDIKAFKDEYSFSICSSFIEQEGYFYLNPTRDNMQYLFEELQKRDVQVLIKNPQTQELHSFDIKAKLFAENYLFTLTDITSFDEEAKKSKYKATYDSLTNIYNREKLNELFLHQIYKSQTTQNTFAFVMIDIDFFKKVNDTYGHLAGDTVLIHLTKLIQKHIRGSDIFARWGGEEFALILPSVNKEKAEAIINNLRIKIETDIFPEVRNITCSFGITNYTLGDTPNSMTQRADGALYEAKKSGRNKVCIKN